MRIIELKEGDKVLDFSGEEYKTLGTI